jgi:CubicO group peptidase (beta-lactamase class C family)
MSEALKSLSSGALRVTVGGQPVLEHYAGTTGQTNARPCTTGTRFQIASISKQFTAAATLTLVRDKQVAVGDKVVHWFPHGPSGWDAITVHQLLTHTSGLGQWEDFPEIDVFAKTEDDLFLAAITSHPLIGVPGSRFYYSSPGYWLLAQIIEKAAGCSYSEFLARAVLEPAELADTFVGSPGKRTNVASGHSDALPVASYELDYTGKGAGDIYSTARDLERWNRSVSGPLLGDSCRAMMFTAHAAAGQSLGSWAKDDTYGYGWYLSSNVSGMTMYYHSGHNSGFNSFNAWVPNANLSMSILTNDDSIDPQTIARTLLTEHPEFLAHTY